MKSDILKNNSLNVKSIHVPEWGMDCFIRVMTGKEREQWFDRIKETNTVAWLVCSCLCDKDGKRVFTDEEIDMVSGLNGLAIERIWKESAKLNLLTADSISDEKKT